MGEDITGNYPLGTTTPSSSSTPTTQQPLETDPGAVEFSGSNQPPLTPSASIGLTSTASHSFMFRGPLTEPGIRKLFSNKFMAGGYEWAIDLYPCGTRFEDNEYISLFITLESNAINVTARFELMLIDQSGKSNHNIQTQFGTESDTPAPCLMKHKGSQWGFRRYVKKKNLEKMGYLKDDCIIVKCRVGVVEFHKENESLVTWLSDQDHGSSMFVEVENSENFTPKGAKLSLLKSPVTQTGLMLDHNRDTSDDYLQVVEEIQRETGSGIVEGQEIMGIDENQMAMKRLVMKFNEILGYSNSMIKNDVFRCNRAGFSVEIDRLSLTDCSSSITSDYINDLMEGDDASYGLPSSTQVYCLRSITERLNSTEYLSECVEIYKVSQKNVVDAIFMRFGIGKWSISDIRSSDWKQSAQKIKLWVRAVHMFFIVIFPMVKQNYEKIFEGMTYDNCFLDIVKDVGVQLCKFAETISRSPASEQKLLDILDLYKYLSLYLPEIDSTFHFASYECICAKKKARRTLDRLANLARDILSTFRESVLHEQSDTPICGGSIHSVTRYAVNYVYHIIMHYQEILDEVIISEPEKSSEISDEIQFLEAGKRSPLALHLICIIIALKKNLYGKSKQYKDAYLGHLFFMNNIHHIVEEMKGSYELLEMIGKDYLAKYLDVMEAATSYLASWDRVLYCFRHKGLYNKIFTNGISKNALKERFKTFNVTFEEVCEAQSNWLVPSSQLREQLHHLILEKLIPAYKLFLEQFEGHISGEKNFEKYIKYSAQDLEKMIYNLFGGGFIEPIHMGISLRNNT